jgi:amino acid transporter
MATNGPVENGGAYYIISRALGHKLGGALGCTYYLGLSLLAVLEVLGAVEVGLDTTFHSRYFAVHVTNLTPGVMQQPKHVQLMTAGMVHVNGLAPGSVNSTCG